MTAVPRRLPVAITLCVLLLPSCREMAPPESSPVPPGPPSSVSTPSAAESGPTTAAPAAPSPAFPELELPAFTPSAYSGWLSTIPDVSLDIRLPAADTDIDRPDDPVRAAFCGRPAFEAEDVVARSMVSATGPEYGEGRDLRLFTDDAAAHRFVAQALRVVAACPEQEVGTTLRTHAVHPSLLGGEESFTIRQTFRQDGLRVLGANWWEVVRIGNAVLLTASGGEWLPGRPLETGIRSHARVVAPVVRAMCSFSAWGCGGDVPIGFPLVEGWPTDEDAEPGTRYGLAGPSRDLQAIDHLPTCGLRPEERPFVDRVLARWTNPEDFRQRQLTSYDDADAAEAAVAQTLAFYRACPSGEADDGYANITRFRRTAVGDESWAVITHTEYHGHPAIGLSVLHIVRLGRAILLDVTSNEGGAGPDLEAEIRRQLRFQTRAASGVVAAMCAFTEAGCASGG